MENEAAATSARGSQGRGVATEPREVAAQPTGGAEITPSILVGAATLTPEQVRAYLEMNQLLWGGRACPGPAAAGVSMGSPQGNPATTAGQSRLVPNNLFQTPVPGRAYGVHDAQTVSQSDQSHPEEAVGIQPRPPVKERLGPKGGRRWASEGEQAEDTGSSIHRHLGP